MKLYKKYQNGPEIIQDSVGIQLNSNEQPEEVSLEKLDPQEFSEIFEKFGDKKIKDKLLAKAKTKPLS